MERPSTETPVGNPKPARRFALGRWAYLLAAAASAGAAVLVVMLLLNVDERRDEARRDAFRVVPLTEDTIDPAEWGKNYPRQCHSYLLTTETAPTRFGGGDAI